MKKWVEEKQALRDDVVREDSCGKCGAPVLRALAGRVAALEVTADPEPLTEREHDAETRSGGLVWCLATPKWGESRILWPETVRPWCQHDRVREHRCDREEEMFEVVEPDRPKRPEPKRDRWGRYMLPHPVTGKEQAFMRTTTFAKMASDTFNLTQWQMRNVAKGIAARQDLRALASTLDIAKDAKKLNEICEQAKEAAGGTSAATLGTALHAMTESVDETGWYDDVAPEYLARIKQYRACVEDAGIETIPAMIERVVVNAEFEVAGTFDRVVKLDDGTHAVFDLKTGRDLSYGMNEIAVQLAIYAGAVNTAGVWNFGAGTWEEAPRVREDFAIVAHLPASGDGCTLYKVDIEQGYKGAVLCSAVRDYRKLKGVAEVYAEAPPATFQERNPVVLLQVRIAAAKSRDELVAIATDAKAQGRYSLELQGMCRRRLQELGA